MTSSAAIEAIERELVPRFWDRLRVFGLRRLGDSALAEDLAQEVLRRVTEALRNGRVAQVDALPGFVFQTAKHVCLNEFRSRSRADRAHARLSAGAGAATPADDPLDRLVSAETRGAVRQAVDQLTPPDRELLRRLFFTQEDSSEVAKSLGITPGALRVRKHRALSRVAELLGDRRL